jgi:hypothetical protein
MAHIAICTTNADLEIQKIQKNKKNKKKFKIIKIEII